MTMGMIFWILMIFWFVQGLYVNRSDLRSGNYYVVGGGLLQFILLFLLGWKVFGSAVKDL